MTEGDNKKEEDNKKHEDNNNEDYSTEAIHIARYFWLIPLSGLYFRLYLLVTKLFLRLRQTILDTG